MKLLTTAEVAERLGLHRTRIQVLIREGRLPAHRYGKAYLVEEKDLPLISDRKPGRPKKAQGGEPAIKAGSARKTPRKALTKNASKKDSKKQ